MSDLIKNLKDSCMCGEPFYDRPCIYCESRERIAKLEKQCESMLRINESIGEAYEKCCEHTKQLEARIAEFESAFKALEERLKYIDPVALDITRAALGERE